MENNKSVTAVEWFEQQLDNLDIEIPYIIFAEAKEMHKEQIVDAYREGRSDQQSARNQSFYHRNAEQYYKETFNNE